MKSTDFLSVVRYAASNSQATGHLFSLALGSGLSGNRNNDVSTSHRTHSLVDKMRGKCQSRESEFRNSLKSAT